MHLTGHCHCGAVQFTVDGEPLRMAQCHCDACRRLTGTGHNVAAFFKRSDVSYSGETRTHQSIADSGSTRTRHFCPTCGSRLFTENSRSPDVLGIPVGVIDETSWYRPSVIHYGKLRPAWDTIDPTIEIHEAM